MATDGISFIEVLYKDHLSIDLGGRNSILGNSKNDFCCTFNMYSNFLKEAYSFKETDKAVSQHLPNHIRRLCYQDLATKYLTGDKEGKPCGSNFCFILNNLLILKK